MKVHRYKLEGLILIEPKVFGDHRGFFFESFKTSSFEKEELPTQFYQDNHSRSSMGVLRGLHFQIPPKAQGKLVRVIRGSVMDVCLDIRKNSNTYGEWVAEELSEDNKKMLYVPPGFAHGFITISETADFLYKVTSEYAPDFEYGINPLDIDLKIPWKEWCKHDLILSEKDKNSSSFQNFTSPFDL